MPSLGSEFGQICTHFQSCILLLGRQFAQQGKLQTFSVNPTVATLSFVARGSVQGETDPIVQV